MLLHRRASTLQNLLLLLLPVKVRRRDEICRIIGGEAPPTPFSFLFSPSPCPAFRGGCVSENFKHKPPIVKRIGPHESPKPHRRRLGGLKGPICI